MEDSPLTTLQHTTEFEISSLSSYTLFTAKRENNDDDDDDDEDNDDEEDTDELHTCSSTLNYHHEKTYNESEALVPGILLVGVLNIFTDTVIGSSLVPIIPQTLHVNEVYQSIVLSSGSMTACLGTFFFGWLSDTYGWLIALSLFYPFIFLSCLLLLIAGDRMALYLASRTLAGIAISFMYPSNLRMVSSTHSRSLRATAVGFTLAGDIGSLCGPVGGAFLYDKGGAFLTFGCLTGVCLLSALAFIRVVSTSDFVASERARLYQYLFLYTQTSDQSYFQASGIQPLCSLNSKEISRDLAYKKRKLDSLKRLFQKITNEIMRMKCFWSFPFLSRAVNLFFAWGTSVVLQVTLPYHWERILGYRPETVGLLFLPHLTLRVLSCATATYISDSTGIQLSSLICLGSFFSWIAVILLFIYPFTQIVPILIASAFLGLGVGISDCCTFAWTSLYAAHLSRTPSYKSHIPCSLSSDSHRSVSSTLPGKYEGRGFALMSVACDLGIVTLPVFTSFLTYYTFSHAYVFLSLFGGIVFLLCLLSCYTENDHETSSPRFNVR